MECCPDSKEPVDEKPTNQCDSFSDKSMNCFESSSYGEVDLFSCSASSISALELDDFCFVSRAPCTNADQEELLGEEFRNSFNDDTESDLREFLSLQAKATATECDCCSFEPSGTDRDFTETFLPFTEKSPQNSSESFPDLSRIIVKKPVLDNAVERLGGGKKGAQLLWKLIQLWLPHQTSTVDDILLREILDYHKIQANPNAYDREHCPHNPWEVCMNERAQLLDQLNASVIQKVQSRRQHEGCFGPLEPCIFKGNLSSIDQKENIEHQNANWADQYASSSELRFLDEQASGDPHIFDSLSTSKVFNYPSENGLILSIAPCTPPSWDIVTFPSGYPTQRQPMYQEEIQQEGNSDQFSKICVEACRGRSRQALTLAGGEQLEKEAIKVRTSSADTQNLQPCTLAAMTRAARKSRMARQKRFMSQYQAPPRVISSPPPPPVAAVLVGRSSLHQDGHETSFCSDSKADPTADTPEVIQGQNSEKDLEFMFEKELKPSDVGVLGRIILPKRYAEVYLPHLTAREGIALFVEDMETSQVWQFKFRFWPNNKSRMYVLENTGNFVKSHGLAEGDIIVLYKDCKSAKYVISGKKTKNSKHHVTITSSHGSKRAAPAGCISFKSHNGSDQPKKCNNKILKTATHVENVKTDRNKSVSNGFSAESEQFVSIEQPLLDNIITPDFTSDGAFDGELEYLASLGDDDGNISLEEVLYGR